MLFLLGRRLWFRSDRLDCIFGTDFLHHEVDNVAWFVLVGMFDDLEPMLFVELR